MKVLVVGGGGREHALAWRLARDPEVTELHCAPGNPGLEAVATCHPVAAEDVPGLVELAGPRLGAGLVVVGPEGPLELGLVDALTGAGVTAFGPTRAAARVETSKAYGKSLAAGLGIPTPASGTFDSAYRAEEFIRRLEAAGRRAVVKADGLAAGKGVVVAGDAGEAVAAVRDMLVGGRFGASGLQVVVEEHLAGEEVSVLALCDGHRLLVLPPVQDHKPAWDGNRGPNTGGMGTYSPLEWAPRGLVDQVRDTILEPALAGLAAAGTPFRGVLFAGLMLTAAGPRVLEYNARFGDPEAQVLMPLLEGSLAGAMLACARGDLASAPPLAGSGRAAACVVMASPGYPGPYPKGIELTGLQAAQALNPGVMVFQAGTARDAAGRLVTSGGRVLGVTAVAGALPDAVELAYQAVGRIGFPGAHYRRDIGRRKIEGWR